MHVRDLFDMFAGTSTGSILASALSLKSTTNSSEPRYWATDAITGSIFADTPPTDYLGNVIGAPDGAINSSYSGSGSNKWIPNPTLADMVRGTGYSVPVCGNITKVEALYHIDIDGLVLGDDDKLKGFINFSGADWYSIEVITNE